MQGWGENNSPRPVLAWARRILAQPCLLGRVWPRRECLVFLGRDWPNPFWAKIGPTILGWVRPSRLGRTSPAHWILYILFCIIYIYIYMKKNYKNYAKIIKKYMWFCCNFITVLWLISVVILYCKDTKFGIKIPGFHQNIKDFQNKKCLLLSKIF